MNTNTEGGQDAKLSWFERIPKVELHLHLEGAIPHEALWELIQKYGGDPSVPNLEALGHRFEYRDFRHFVETWVWKNQFLREYEDFLFIARAVAEDLARQNIRYAEMYFSPTDFRRRLPDVQCIAAAVRSAPCQKAVLCRLCSASGVCSAIHWRSNTWR